MAAGRTVLSTKLPGIPDEYYNYIFTTDHDPLSISRALDKLAEKDISELSRLGELSRNFVVNEKSIDIQAKRIINFLQSI
jgi:hypothetical protein